MLLRVGGRRYVGRFYVGLEVGYAAIRKGGYTEADPLVSMPYHPISYQHGVSVAAGIGGKIYGVVDIGLSLIVPAVGLQVHFGIDFTQF